MNKLKNKVAVVTGASKGIGAGIALQLASEGAKIVVNYANNKNDADKVVEKIKDTGGEAIAVQAAVEKEPEVLQLFEKAHAAFGKIDILINNAGVYAFSNLEDIDDTHFHQHFNVNVLGLLYTSKAAARHFGNEGGSIINISSITANTPMAGGAVYSSTKAAVDSITKVLSVELRDRKIRVNAISPGLIETEGTKTAGIIDSEMHQQILNSTFLGRTGKPSDIGKVATFLASDESEWITGEILQVTGGQR